MTDFASRLRAKLSGDSGKKKRDALLAVARWMENEVALNLESSLEHAVEEGRDRVVFRHAYPNGFRLNVDDIEKLPEYEFLVARCKLLGLSAVVMSHKRLGDADPALYPCAEVLVFIPPSWGDGAGGKLAGL
ncbi:MAG: hypothetical protein AAB923_00605 [Patescibacteria group bacterium]